jgi:hypothetical protein
MASATKRTCRAHNKRGEPCGARAVTADGLCAIHGGVVDPKAIGRKGGRGRTRKGMGGKQLSASLRERLRASIDEDPLAEVLVAGLESENAKERLDVAKLVLNELAEGQKRAERCICATGKPGDYCSAVAAESKFFSQMGALDADSEKQMLERLLRRPNRQIEAAAEAIVPAPSPSQTIKRASVSRDLVAARG